ncbi:HK97 family phage prohead protease [Phyllobacterium sp. 1468]|nr:HK97 family phage prohead protease [Phyllobacterium sp. 1468]
MSDRRFLPRLEKKYTGLTVEAIAQDGSFSGYASLFGEVDLGKDAIEAGAFLKSIQARGAAGIRMLWQHDPNQPIGTWTVVREDKRGLYVEGKLAKGVAKASEVLELMRSGAVDGLSIGFKTIKAKAGRGGIRHIHEADLWEISVVTFPMLPSARVGQVKSLPADALPDKDYSNQHRLLWNIKANEVLIEALKRSPQSDYNGRWLARLQEENAELKSHSTLYEPFQIWVRKYNPHQPRVSAGNADGGQWTDGGGGSGSPLAQEAFDRRWGTASRPASETRIVSGHGRFGGGAALANRPGTGPKAPDGTPVQLAQSGGGRRGSGPNIRIIAGRAQEVTPEQELRIETSRIRADEAVRRVQQRDAGWKPQPGLYDTAEGLIRYHESVARQAEYRERELSGNWLGQNGGPPLNDKPGSGQQSRRDELLQTLLPRPSGMSDAVLSHRSSKTPNEGTPGSRYKNPGNGQVRIYGSDGKPIKDIDSNHDHGYGIPHVHDWERDENGKAVRGSGRPFDPTIDE